MSLSDKEIKELFEKAEYYQEARGNDLPYLEQAIECYNQIIENTPPHPHYFYKRAALKHCLSSRLDQDNLLEGAIEDINKAIGLDPDRGWYYCSRAEFLWDKVYSKNPLKEDVSDENKNQLLKNIIVDYKSCINKAPTEPAPWLCLIAINIICHNWDDAISVYGSCKPYMEDGKDRLIRSWLGCLAFTLAGDRIGEDDRKPLYDSTIRLSGFYDREGHICFFLGKSREKRGYNKEEWEKINEIARLFISHYDNWCDRADLLRYLKLYEEALVAYEKAIGRDPNYVLAWDNKSWILQKLNRHEEALKAINITIELRPDDARFWHRKGQILQDIKHYQEALGAYDKAIELNPDFTSAVNDKHNLLQELNKDAII